MAEIWIALSIGNSRLHWALFEEATLLSAWRTPHLEPHQVSELIRHQFSQSAWQAAGANLASLGQPRSSAAPTVAISLTLPPKPALWLASVVKSQQQLWEHYPALKRIQRDHIPLTSQYSTLGCDRALALYGAGSVYGWPVLVIDGGTALTLTAGTKGSFQGGAILPGLALQAQSLASYTDALPVIDWPERLPPRWARSTDEAIQSGLIFTVLSGIQTYIADWWRHYPDGQGVLTGGDGQRLWSYLNQINPETTSRLRVDENLIFWGIRAYRAHITNSAFGWHRS